MDFRLSEEQQQFSESLRRWIERDYSFEDRKKIVYSDSGVSEKAFAALNEIGAIPLGIPEEAGGLGGSSEDLMIVMQELGRGLVVEPYFATVLASDFLRRGEQKKILEDVATGTVKLACALNEKNSGHELFNITTSAKKDGDAYVINGAKCAVIHGAQANGWVVSTRTNGEKRDEAGITLFYVPSGSNGVNVVDFRTFDGQRAANIEFNNVRVPASSMIGSEGQGWNILEAATDFGITLLCAEAVGAMEAANAQTLEYLKTRKQFGVPIGTFQVLQHRMADMYMHAQQAKSLTILAAVKVNQVPAEERRKLVSAAKVRVGQAARFVGAGHTNAWRHGHDK
jgi:alkylation response protein AidB-like acyl-CoA dehydrogenase